ncbi:MAG: hypothetical protein AB7H71_14020 [Alphaproteobacteria bacterium]
MIFNAGFRELGKKLFILPYLINFADGSLYVSAASTGIVSQHDLRSSPRRRRLTIRAKTTDAASASRHGSCRMHPISQQSW